MQARPTPAIEAIAYFCVAELLANVAQHAQASRASIFCTQQGSWLRLVVRDDGTGGAQLTTVGSSSSGLAGLADRVHAVDGQLYLVSPPGGPTVVDRRPSPLLLMVGALRIAIAEDSAILRDGLVQLLVDRGFAITGAVGDPAALRSSVAQNPPGRRGDRHPHAADLHRRGSPPRPRAAGPPRGAGHPAVLPVHRDPLRRRPAGGRRRRYRLPVEGPGGRRQRLRRGAGAGRRRRYRLGSRGRDTTARGDAARRFALRPDRARARGPVP